jgi:hypothetical protein
MKKFVIAATAALGLMGLAACNRSPEGAAIENSADAMADNMETRADSMEAAADNSSNAMVSDMMENKADAIDAKADNVREAGDAMADKADEKAKDKK